MEENNKLIEYADVPGTPFQICKNSTGETTRYIPLIGPYRVFPDEGGFETSEEALESIKEPTWATILQVVAVLIKEQNIITNG